MNKSGRECCRRSPEAEAIGPAEAGNIGREAADTGGWRSCISWIGEVETEPRR